MDRNERPVIKYKFPYRMICDSWLCLDFPLHESGQALLLKASNLRRKWNKLLALKLEGLIIEPIIVGCAFKNLMNFSAMKDNVENASAKGQKSSSNQLEKELWHSLAAYMNSEIPYTIKRLLPADLKVF